MIPFDKQINHFAIERKKIYDSLSSVKKQNLEKLSNCVWKDIKPIVIKRSKEYPEIGDIFEYKPNNNITLFGIVINNYVKYKYDEEDNFGWLTVAIFSPKVTNYLTVVDKITKNDLLLYPSKVSTLHWKKGYFNKINHIESFNIVDSYGYDNPFEGRYETDEGKPINKQPSMFVITGIMTEFGLSYEILYQLIVNGVEFDLPINN